MQTTTFQPGEVIDALATADTPAETKTSTLVKNDRIKIVRLVLPAGKILPEHKAPGELTVHCLAGKIDFTTMGKTHSLDTGKIIYLTAGELHSVEAKEDSLVLLTIVS